MSSRLRYAGVAAGLAAALVCGCVLSGCAGPTIVGQWEAKSSPGAELTPGVWLLLSNDRTFVLREHWPPAKDNDVVTGAWRTLKADGAQLLELTVTKATNNHILGGRQKVAFEYRLDADVLTLPDGFNREGTVQFVRVPRH